MGISTNTNFNNVVEINATVRGRQLTKCTKLCTVSEVVKIVARWETKRFQNFSKTIKNYIRLLRKVHFIRLFFI